MTNRKSSRTGVPAAADTPRAATERSEGSRTCTPESLVALSRAVTTARLLSGVVHEVNNALLVVTGTVELLEARPDLPEAAVRPLERLRTQGQRMAAVIAQVAGFTHAPLGERCDVDVAEVARVAVELRRFAVTRAGLTIHSLAGGAPCLVRGNSGELQQAVLNLIVSAEHALAGTRGRIEVEVSGDAETVTVRVSDTRPASAAPPDDLFEPFTPSRAPSDTSGLNLYAAREIAESHGGALVVDATGASFMVRLPSLPAPRRYAAPSST